MTFELTQVKSAQKLSAVDDVITAVLCPYPLSFRINRPYHTGPERTVIRCYHPRLAPRRVIKARQVPAALLHRAAAAAAFPAGVGHHSSRRRGKKARVINGVHGLDRQHTCVHKVDSVSDTPLVTREHHAVTAVVDVEDVIARNIQRNY